MNFHYNQTLVEIVYKSKLRLCGSRLDLPAILHSFFLCFKRTWTKGVTKFNGNISTTRKVKGKMVKNLFLENEWVFPLFPIFTLCWKFQGLRFDVFHFFAILVHAIAEKYLLILFSQVKLFKGSGTYFRLKWIIWSALFLTSFSNILSRGGVVVRDAAKAIFQTFFECSLKITDVKEISWAESRRKRSKSGLHYVTQSSNIIAITMESSFRSLSGTVEMNWKKM